MLPLKVERAEVPKFRISPGSIVEALNEIEDVGPRPVACHLQVEIAQSGAIPEV